MEDDGVALLHQANAELGEGPVWDPRAEALFWVDIRRCRIHRYSTAKGRQDGVWVMRNSPGCVALTTDPGVLVVAAGAEVLLLDLASGGETPVATLPINASLMRANDGRVDQSGRLWVGAMIDDVHKPDVFSEGALFRVHGAGTVVKVLGDCELPNGIGWSPDERTLYFNDTTTLATWAFDFDPDAGEIANRRKFFDHSGRAGFPDGLSVDATGAVWSAQWDGWNIRRIAPDGSLIAEYAMPIRRPSSVGFFGLALDMIAVTSATVDFCSTDFKASPDAGSLFSLQAPRGVIGQPENYFAI